METRSRSALRPKTYFASGHRSGFMATSVLVALTAASAFTGCGDALDATDSSSGGSTSTGTIEGAAGNAGSGGGANTITPKCPGQAENAYLGVATAIPGTIEGENFDPAGYEDTTEGNEGAAYRTDTDVDVKSIEDGYAVGWMMAGEYLEFTIEVATAGEYVAVVRTGAVESGRTLTLSECGVDLTTPLSVPTVSDWGAFRSVTTKPFTLEAGVQVLRVSVGELDYLDLDSIRILPASEVPTTTKFVGNITTGNGAAMDVGGRTYSDYWDQVTPENAGKWGSVQGTADSPLNWTTLDSIYDYAKQKGIVFKQHTFVWGPQQPSGTLTETHVKNWIQQFCARYPDTKVIDVVNEPPPHTEPTYANAIGGGTNTTWQWIVNAFTWADEYCPNAILVLNDYNNIEWGDQNQHFIDIANALQDAGAPIDAVGAQTHGLSDGVVSTQTMKTLLTKLHDDTGLPVYITEYDIDLADDAAQLAKFQEHIPFFLETEWIHGVTLWGWIHGQTWIPESGLIRDGEARPSMTWLMEQLGRPAP